MPAVSESPTSRQIPWWLWGNVLSLDAPLVAMSWQWMLARVFEVNVPAGCYFLLWMVVWSVYVADRIMDSFSVQKTDPSHLTARHAFYLRHRGIMLRTMLPVLLIITGWLVMFVAPIVLIERGLVLAFMVGLYLLHYAGSAHKIIYRMGNLMAVVFGLWLIWKGPLMQTLVVVDYVFWQQTFFEDYPVSQILWSSALLLMAFVAWRGWSLRTIRRIPKELLCGIFFALGCVLSVHFYSLDEVSGPLSLSMILLAMMASLNCIGIACQESKTDEITDALAITQNWPQVSRRYGMILMGCLGFLIALRFNAHVTDDYKLLLTGSSISVFAMALIHMASGKLPVEFPRVLMDAALLLPAVFVWWTAL